MMKLFVLAACVAAVACGGGSLDGNGNGIIGNKVTPKPLPNPTCPIGLRERICKGAVVLREYDGGRRYINCLANNCFRCAPGTLFSNFCQVCVFPLGRNDPVYEKANCKKIQKTETKGPKCPNDSCPFCAQENELFQFAATTSKNFYCQCPYPGIPQPICQRCPPGTVFEQPEVLKSGCCVTKSHSQ